MGTRKTGPEYSAGARYERRAFRAYLRRNLSKPLLPEDILNWVLKRMARYGDKPGGL